MKTENQEFEIGIYTLGDYVENAQTGNKVSEQERIEEIIAYAKKADEVGLDVFALGESHQEHFVSQAHTVILGAIARETKNIRISSSASIISTSDPVRVYEDFSTVDLLSNGRAEIIAGRASRVGLFELLGYDLKDYEELFEEKFELLKLLNEEKVVNWQGDFRKPLHNAVLYPKPKNGSIPLWRAVGGPAASAMKAGAQGVPMMLATLGGPAELFNESIEAFRSYADHYGHGDLPVGVTALFHVAKDDISALREFYPNVDLAFRRANGSGFSKVLFSQQTDKRAVMLIGSVDNIVEKILYQYDMYKHDRLLLQLDVGGMELDAVLEQIDIIGKEIAPRVKAAIKERQNDKNSSN